MRAWVAPRILALVPHQRHVHGDFLLLIRHYV